MAVTPDALLVAERLGERLAERNADVLDRVVGVDVQVALGRDIEIEHTVARDLVEHVVEKGHAGIERAAAAAVKIELDVDLRFLGVAFDFSCAHD